jgi:hypothetical protein
MANKFTPMDPTKWAPIKAGIFAGESGGDYDALFGYSNREGGPFAGTKVTDMTIDEAIAFADPSGPYAQWVKGQIGRVATPMGGFQTVGTTLKDARDRGGFDGSQKMTPQMQDQLGQWIYSQQGTGAWEGYKGPIAQNEILPMRGLDGKMDLGSLQGIVGNALDRSDEPSVGKFQGALSSSTSSMNGPQGGPQGGPQQEYDNSGLYGMFMPNMTEDQRQKRMLAIGAGLLSGKNWHEGFAGASQNLFGVQNQDDQNAFTLARDQKALEAKAMGTTAGDFTRVGSVLMPDGSEVGGVSFDNKTGQFVTIDAKGNRQILEGAQPLSVGVASGTGMASASTMQKAQTELLDMNSGLRSMDRVISALPDMTYGSEGFINDIKFNLKTLLGQPNLSDEELQRKIVQGEIQGLIGKAREEVVGPGVMTEADAVRVVTALGGDATSIFSNPQVALKLLTQRRDSMLQSYGTKYDQYESNRQRPGNTWVEVPRYTASASGSGNSTSSPSSTTGSSSTPMPKDFPSGQAVWDELSPEERELFATPEPAKKSSPLADATKGEAARRANGISQEDWDLLPEELKQQFIDRM